MKELAFFIGKIDATVVEGINKIGSAFYGPILAAFLTGVISKKVNAPGIFSGIIAGVGFNGYLWAFQPEVFWMWWNFFGLALTVIVAVVVSNLKPVSQASKVEQFTLRQNNLLIEEKNWLPKYALLLGYFLFMLVILMIVSLFLRYEKESRYCPCR